MSGSEYDCLSLRVLKYMNPKDNKTLDMLANLSVFYHHSYNSKVYSIFMHEYMNDILQNFIQISHNLLSYETFWETLFAQIIKNPECLIKLTPYIVCIIHFIIVGTYIYVKYTHSYFWNKESIYSIPVKG